MVTCLIFFKVVKAVHFIQVSVKRPEALGDHTRPGIKDAPEVRLGQLLPVMQGGRTWWNRVEKGSGRDD